MSASARTVMGPGQPHRLGSFEAPHPIGPLARVVLEVRKLKGSSYWWMALGMILLVSTWSGMAFMKRAVVSNPAIRTLTLTQSEVYQIVSLLAPIFAALLTSRLAVMETSEGMGLTWLSLGQSATGMFFAKLVVAALTLSTGFIIPLVWIPLAARARGFTPDGDLAVLILAPVLIVFLSSTAVTAIQLTLSLTLSKQAIGLGAGVIAGLVGSGLGPMKVAGLGWLFPAGISSAANPFLNASGPDGYARLTLSPNPWAQVGASLMACIVWTAISAVMVKIKESHR